MCVLIIVTRWSMNWRGASGHRSGVVQSWPPLVLVPSYRPESARLRDSKVTSPGHTAGRLWNLILTLFSTPVFCEFYIHRFQYYSSLGKYFRVTCGFEFIFLRSSLVYLWLHRGLAVMRGLFVSVQRLKGPAARGV